MFTQVSQQFANIWRHQSPGQRMVLVVLLIAALVLAVVFISWAGTPSYAVAFSGLSEADGGQIVEKLAEQEVQYQLRGSGTILVPSDQLYEIRLRMAREGLPQGGNVGLELFNGNTFGMTEFTQRVNYQRAMEGELERTIGSLAAVSAVRVHIVTPEKSLLSEDQVLATASVTVKENPGERLDAAQVRAITHLVASSVEGLRPENVVVVDVNGSMLASGTTDGAASILTQTDSHRAAEIAASTELQKKVQGLLDSALGPNRAVVQANVSMDWTERETTRQAYDPSTSTVRSSQAVSEVYTTTAGLVGGIPGASSNLPQPDNTNVNGEQGTQYQRSEQTTNYEVTQTETHERQAPGQIERISLSVLVDDIINPDQLSTLKSVIAAAAGIDESRGDVVAVQSLAFDRSYLEQRTADMDANQKNDLYWRIGEAVAAFLFVAALLWYVQRLLANLRLASSQAWTPIIRPVAEMALATPGSIDVRAEVMTPKLSAAPSIPEKEFEAPVFSAADEQLQRMVVRLAEENPAAVAEIIQLWLREDEKRS